jgi:hypothetical protein
MEEAEDQKAVSPTYPKQWFYRQDEAEYRF